jgi:hypothetical protein
MTAGWGASAKAEFSDSPLKSYAAWMKKKESNQVRHSLETGAVNTSSLLVSLGANLR